MREKYLTNGLSLCSQLESKFYKQRNLGSSSFLHMEQIRLSFLQFSNLFLIGDFFKKVLKKIKWVQRKQYLKTKIKNKKTHFISWVRVIGESLPPPLSTMLRRNLSVVSRESTPSLTSRTEKSLRWTCWHRYKNAPAFSENHNNALCLIQGIKINKVDFSKINWNAPVALLF